MSSLLTKLGLERPPKNGLLDDADALKGDIAARYRKLPQPDESDQETFDLHFAVGSLLSQGKGRQAGQLIDQLEQRMERAAVRTADGLTDRYEALQKQFGAVYDEAKRRGLLTDALLQAERDIEKTLKRTSADIVADQAAVKRQILGYERIGNNLAAQIQRQRDQERVDAENASVAGKLKDSFEALRNKVRAVHDEATRLKLPTAALTKAEVDAQAKLKNTPAAIVADKAAVEKAILDYDQAGAALAAAIVDHKKHEEEQRRLAAEKQRLQEERDRQMLEGVKKKKAPVPSALPTDPRPSKAKTKYTAFDPGPPMTFKEKFANHMVRRVGAVEKKVTGQDRDGGFSTFYFFAQGDDDKAAYEIHIHRRANGRYLSGQVKFGHLATVVRGGEERLEANEMATYGIPAVETHP